MKILVCISHVPDTTSKINFVDDATAFDKNGVQFIINPNDEFGLTRAVWYQQKQQADMDSGGSKEPSKSENKKNEDSKSDIKDADFEVVDD